jgi:hypothetical protein
MSEPEVFETRLKIIVNEFGTYDITIDDFTFYNTRPFQNSFNVTSYYKAFTKNLQIVLYDNFVEGTYFAEFFVGYTYCTEKYHIKGYRAD